MKKILLSAALLCGISFTSMAAETSVMMKSTKPSEMKTEVATATKKPTEIVCFQVGVCGQPSVICYDNEVRGDKDTAIQVAIGYSCN